MMMWLLDKVLFIALFTLISLWYAWAHRYEWKQEEEVNYNIDVWED